MERDAKLSQFALHELAAPCWQRSPARSVKPRETLSAAGIADSNQLNRPDDVHELEADRIAGQVMRNPVARQGPHDRTGGSADRLDKSTLDFMHANLGYDFSNVRVHRDSAAANKARAVQARAFTVGRDIVFGAGEYAPATPEGRRLIAHELVHVLQQANVSGGLNGRSTEPSGNVMVQRTPDKKAAAGSGVPEDLLLHSRAVPLTGLDHEQRIKTLAANPDHAAFEWKRLSRADQMGVAVQMAVYYGDAFAKEFVALRDLGKKPGLDRADADTEPANLMKRGYRRAGIQQQIDVEVWFRPSGDRLHRTLAAGKSKQAERTEKPVPNKKSKPPYPPIVDPPIVEPPIDCDDVEEEAQGILEAMDQEMDEMEKVVEEDFIDMSKYMDAEGDFGERRAELAELVKKYCPDRDDEVRASIVQQRKELVERLVKARSKAYGTEQTDWGKPTIERD